MCGIIGIVTRRPDAEPVSFESVRPTFSHRGPNDYGEYHAPHIHFGHARLSIQDLSAAGHQPMVSSDGNLWIVFNGEIYNFPELRDELRGLGCTFHSHCDTEVLLEAFRLWGTECVHRLRGMFAFAIWDTRRRKLWLFRDRFGEKPLYYHLHRDYLLFASEFKSILAMLPREPTLSQRMFDRYLHYQYVPEPDTPVEEVAKCPRAHYVELDIDTWKSRTVKYWDVHALPPVEGDPALLVREKLEDAVRVMLRADVDVGLALSGGIDSGAIAAFTAKHSAKEVHSFGIGYPGRPPCDERDRAKELADRLGIRFHDRELENGRLVGFFPELIRAIDEPIADIAAYGHYSVAKAAADHGLRVLLTGIGGDELFWGYPWFRNAAQTNLELQQKSPGAPAKFYNLFREYQIAGEQRPRLFEREILESIPADDSDSVFAKPLSESTLGNSLTEMMFDTWLVGNCLSLGDKVAMASSIEARLPFLDVPLVETVIGLRKTRDDYKLGHKKWLVDSLADVLPAQVLQRPKSGFEPPVKIWVDALCKHHAGHLFHGVASTKLGLRRDFANHIEGTLANKILVFNAWHELCLVQVRQGFGHEIRKQLQAIETSNRSAMDPEQEMRRIWENDPLARKAFQADFKTPDPTSDARGFASSEGFRKAIQKLSTAGFPPSGQVRVLDLLCGNGASSWALAKAGYRVAATEARTGLATGLEGARKLSGLDDASFEVVALEGGSIPAPDHSFQVVWMRGALGRTWEPPALLAEVHRVLAPGGWVVDMQESIVWNDQQKADFPEECAATGHLPDQTGHHLDQLLEAFRSNGFRIQGLFAPGDLEADENPGSGFDLAAAICRSGGTDRFTILASKPTP